jgi:hypothetical protein
MKDEPYLQSQLSCTYGHINEVCHLNKSMEGSWTESQVLIVLFQLQRFKVKLEASMITNVNNV